MTHDRRCQAGWSPLLTRAIRTLEGTEEGGSELNAICDSRLINGARRAGLWVFYIMVNF